MALNKIFLVITLVSFAICEQTSEIPRDTLTRDEFMGVWYDKALLYADYHPKQVYTCNRTNVIKEGSDEEKFEKVYEFTINETVYTVVKFDNGKEMICYGKNGEYYGVVSREPQLSAETKVEFEKLAN